MTPAWDRLAARHSEIAVAAIGRGAWQDLRLVFVGARAREVERDPARITTEQVAEILVRRQRQVDAGGLQVTGIDAVVTI